MEHSLDEHTLESNADDSRAATRGFVAGDEGLGGKECRSSTLATDIDDDRFSIDDTEGSDLTLPSLLCHQSRSESEDSTEVNLTTSKDASQHDLTVSFVNSSIQAAKEYEDAGDLEQAIDTLGRLLEVAGFFDYYGAVQLNIGTLFWKRGAYRASLYHLTQALSEFEIMESSAEMKSRTHLAIGRTHASLGEFREAKKNFRLSSVNAEPGTPLEARATHALGSAFATTGSLGKANRLYQRALSIQKCLGDLPSDTAATLVSFGSLKERTGELNLAMACYTEAHRLYMTLKPSKETTFDRGVVLSSMGWVLHLQGKSKQSISLCSKALELLSPFKDHRNYAAVLLQIGIMKAKDGHHAQAFKIIHEVLRMQRKSLGSRHLDLAASLTAVGLLTTQTPETAVEYLTQALSMRTEILGTEHTDVCLTHCHIDQLYKRMGTSTNATSCHAEAVYK